MFDIQSQKVIDFLFHGQLNSEIKIRKLAWLWIMHFFFYKQPNFWSAEPQIFKNYINLASNCRCSNRKFEAGFVDFVYISPNFVHWANYLIVKRPKFDQFTFLTILIFPQEYQYREICKLAMGSRLATSVATFSLISGIFDSNSRLNQKWGCLEKKIIKLCMKSKTDFSLFLEVDLRFIWSEITSFL